MPQCTDKKVVKKLNNYDKKIWCVPDKSISVRAIVINGFARGESVVRNISLCDDVMSAISCMRALGARIELMGSTAHIVGIGGSPTDGVTLDCGNSGTLAKLLIGALAGMRGSYRIIGDDSLMSRPFGNIVAALNDMGADIKGDRLPLNVGGAELRGVKHIASIASAQEKSAVLLAGINADGETLYFEKIRTRDHTENMLSLAGAKIAVSHDGGISVKRSMPKAFDITVPGDISSASYPICLALVIPGGRCEIDNVCMNGSRSTYIDILRRSGAKITVKNIRSSYGETVGDIIAEYSGALSPLRSTAEESARAIDEIPTLCAVACFIDGTSVFSGVDKLRGKETDRIATTCAALNALGGDVRSGGSDITVTAKKLRYGTVDSCGDHRIAMTAAVAGGAGCGCEILGANCVGVSYPRFFEEVIGD